MRLDSLSRLAAAVAVLAITALLSGSLARAQDQSGNPVVTPTASPMPKAQAAKPTIEQSLPAEAGLDSSEITVLRDNYAGKYNIATLENLSKMYWRLGAFDLQDDLAIGNYVKITDCKIFTNFVNDDLEWADIVKTVRGQLEQSRGTFPLNFQFLIELHLGRYDPDLGGFPLTDKTGFTEAKRIEVDSIDARQEICYDEKAIDDYPKSIFILLPKPFTLDFIKLDEHVAQAYILRKKSEYSKLPEEVRVQRYERDAYLRLRVTFSQYHGNLNADDSTLMGILFGTIDGYEIFEDAAEKRLMLSVDLSKNNQNFSGSGPVSMMMSLPTQASVVAAQKPPKSEEHHNPGSFSGIAPSSGSAMAVSHSFAQ